jgi:hypothetical protein
VPTVATIEAEVTGGCWEDSQAGNIYGAYDQLFWWQGDCGDTVGQVTVEMYPTVAAASAASHHASVNALSARYSDGAVIVDVYANAPFEVLSELGTERGLEMVPGYGA